MTHPKLIGVTGRAQHGKDSVGRILVEQLGFARFGFADQLKSMAVVINPIVEQYNFPKHPVRLATLVSLLGWEKAKEREEVRRFLQVLGTEGVRGHLGEDAWVDALEHRLIVDGFLEPNYNDTSQLLFVLPVVVTDVRFPNEAHWIHSYGGEVWRVERPDFDNGVPATHPSEAGIEVITHDHFIVNDGDLEDLEATVLRTLEGSD